MIVKNLILSVIIPISLSVFADDVLIHPENAVIVSASGRDSMAAAKELKLHLDLISGKKIPLASAGKIPSGRKYIFHVGKNPAGNDEALKKQEAFYKVTPSGAWFWGGKDGGTLFAVYDFLENALGVRWPSGDDIAYRHETPVRIARTEGHWISPISLRVLRSKRTGSPGEKLWKQRLRAARGSDFNYGSGDAVFSNWWKLYGKNHPEYFAMNINGVRAPAPSRLSKVKSGDVAAYSGKKILVAFCCSSEPFLDAVIENWRRQKSLEWLNFTQPDVFDNEACYCEQCRSLDAVKVAPGEKFHGNALSDRYIHMLNNLCKKAIKINPDVKIVTGIYNYSQEPPQKTKIMYPGNCIFSVVPTDFSPAGIQKFFAGWKKAGLKKFIYRPNRHGYFRSLIPCGQEEHFFKIFQEAYKTGAVGFDYDCAWESLHSGQWFSDYVLLKAMQDPTKDFSYWEKHYMQAFGPAAKEVSEYYRYWRENVWNARLQSKVKELQKIGTFHNFGRGLVKNLAKYYKEKDFDEAEIPLKKALARKDLPENVRSRIERLLLENQHSRLIFRAITKPSDINSIELMKFREKNHFPLLPRCEQYWGDICGIKKISTLRDFTPPFLKTPLFWFFKLDPSDAGIREKWYLDDFQKIRKWDAYMSTNSYWETPHRHYKLVSEDIRKKTASYNGIAWYATVLTKIPPDWKNRKIYLYFGAVDESCWVFVNGQKAGEHLDDWQNPFAVEITRCINWDLPSQIVIVRVEDKFGAGGIWKRVMLVSKIAK